jgi:hypothetical protein
MNIYLAGPMRGYPQFNFPAFYKAAAELRAQGHTVFNPAERDIERDGVDWSEVSQSGDINEIEASGFDRRDAIFDDLQYIIREADAIALLPGWEASKGANAELWTAKFLDLKVIELAA